MWKSYVMLNPPFVNDIRTLPAALRGSAEQDCVREGPRAIHDVPNGVLDGCEAQLVRFQHTWGGGTSEDTQACRLAEGGTSPEAMGGGHRSPPNRATTPEAPARAQ